MMNAITHRIVTHLAIVTITALFLSSFSACTNGTPVTPVQKDCPLPEPLFNGFWKTPTVSVIKMRLSPSGKQLLYTYSDSYHLYLLDLATMKQTRINMLARTPPRYGALGIASFEWCPYDDSKIIMQTAGMVDVKGTGEYTKNRFNLFMCSLKDSSMLEVVSPELWGAFGSESSISLKSWLPSSRPGKDMVLISYGDPDVYDVEDIMVHELKSNNRMPSPYKQTGFLLNHWQNKESYPYIQSSELVYSKYINFNGKEFLYPELDRVRWISISPNGKKAALSVLPKVDTVTNTGFARVWIFNLDSIQAHPTKKPTYRELNFQKLYCKYNFHGVWAEYISDSTLVVSMHADGDKRSPMWEISDTGALIRLMVE